MGSSEPVVLSVSAWAGARHARLVRAQLAFLYLCLLLVALLPLLLLLGDGTLGLSWVWVLVTAVLAVPAATLAFVARASHRHLAELRAAGRPGEVTVHPDHLRIHHPGVLDDDLVLTSSQLRAVCVDERRPVWAACYWYRFPISSTGPGRRLVGCLFRPGLPNALQLVAPTPAAPNVALVFTEPLRLSQATGLGQAGESLAVLVAPHDDIETTQDLPGARPLDPARAHAGLFLKVDSAAAARRAFSGWASTREVLLEADVRHLSPTPVPGAARTVAGVAGFLWAVLALAVVAHAILTRSWGLVVPVVLVPAAVGTLAHQTFRSLRGLGRGARSWAGTLVAVSLLVVTVVVEAYEIGDLTTFDDPPPREPAPSYYIPEDPFPEPQTPVPFPSQGTWDPLRP